MHARNNSVIEHWWGSCLQLRIFLLFHGEIWEFYFTIGPVFAKNQCKLINRNHNFQSLGLVIMGPQLKPDFDAFLKTHTINLHTVKSTQDFLLHKVRSRLSGWFCKQWSSFWSILGPVVTETVSMQPDIVLLLTAPSTSVHNKYNFSDNLGSG